MDTCEPSHPAGTVWKPIAWVALVLFGASLGVNVALLWRLRQAPAAPITTERLVPGTQVLPLGARSLTGDPVRLAAGRSQPTILYFFSTSCGWCARNWPNVLALEAATRGRYEFIAISNSIDTAEFVTERALPFTCLTGVRVEALRRLHIGGTPRTIVVSRDGVVMRDWVGAYTDATLREVEQAFGVTLPGLQ